MKKIFMILSAIALCFACVCTLASCGSKPEDIAIVKYVTHTSLNEIEENVIAQIKAEDSSLKIRCYNTNAKEDQINQTLTSLKKKKVKTVVCIATPVAATAVGIFANTNTKLIFSAVSDPSKLVSNYDQPEGNITGTSDAVDLDKQIELAQSVNPALSKIGYIYTLAEENSKSNAERLKTICQNKGIRLVEKPITSTGDITTVFDSIKNNVDALIVTDDNNVASVMNTLANACIEAKLPCYCAADSEIKDGGMMGYSINYKTLGKDTGSMAVKAATGTAISSIPVKVYGSSELSLYYNSTFITNANITVPASLLANATDLAK